jgi:hypothetical protein
MRSAELIEDVAQREELLLGDHPGRRELRVEDGLEVGAERAVPVGAQRARQEEPVAEGNVLLDEAAQRAALGRGLIRIRDDRAAVTVCAPGGSSRPKMPLRLNTLRVYCTPSVVRPSMVWREGAVRAGCGVERCTCRSSSGCHA